MSAPANVCYRFGMRWKALSALALAPLILCASCGGGPLLQNVPRPNAAVMAGIAAGAAAAVTVANPGAAARLQEQKNAKIGEQPVENEETIPLDLLDRMDAADQQPPDENQP